MPAAKKPASKTKTTTTKKAAVKRAPAKAKSATKVKQVKAQPVQSFRASKPEQPFMTFQITRQTIYWLILAVIVVSLAAWVLSISIKVQNIYDEIDATNRITESSRVTPKAR